jgi:hypothetical protein
MSKIDYPLGSIIVCVPLAWEAPFADDANGTCAECSVAVRYRPYVPEHVTKICITCASKRVGRKGEAVEVRVTQQTLEELALYYSKGTKQ